MSKVRLTGSNSGYVEIAAAADAGNLTFTMPTSGTALLGNSGNVFSGITTTGQLDINGSIDVSSTSVFNDDVTFTGGSYNVLWDKSDNALEFADNAVIKIGSSGDLELFHDGNNSYIKEVGTGALYIRGSEIQLQSVSGEQMIGAFTDGGVTLRSDNVIRLTTTNTGVVVTGICTATSFSGSGEGLTRTTQLSHRNLIINGAMQVAQRGTSSSADGYQTVDRFKFGYGGENEAPVQYQGTLASHESPYAEGHRYTYYVQNGNQTGGAGAGDYAEFQYKVEAQDMATCGWNYTSASSFITLSFWVKSNVGQNFYGFVYSADGTAQRYIFQTGNITANSWNKIVVTIPGGTNVQFDNNNGEGLIIKWIPFYGTNKTNNSATPGSWANYNGAARCPDYTSTWWTTDNSTFYITGVQLEVGQQATPFEHRSFGEELARCSRYLQIFHVPTTNSRRASNITATVHGTGSGVYLNVAFPYPMRAAPSLTVDGAFGGNVFTGSWAGATLSSITAEYHTDALSTLGFHGITAASVTGSHTTGLTGQIYTNSNGTDAALIYSAEL